MPSISESGLAALARPAAPAPPLGAINPQMLHPRHLAPAVALLVLGSALAADVPLPSSKILVAPAPGDPQPTNSFPSAMALSPDGNTVALLNNGFGTDASGLRQSIALLDRTTGKLTDFPDPRLGYDAAQTAFVGLAWASSGQELYVSFASLSHPEPDGKGATGNGVAVYRYEHGALTPERFLPVAPRTIGPDRTATAPIGEEAQDRVAPYPAGLAVIPGAAGDRLLVAANLSDEAIVLDATTGEVLARVDVGSGRWVPSAFPYGAVASHDGKKAWVSLWNASEVVELDLEHYTVTRRIPLLKPAVATAPGSHPSTLLLSADERQLYVALSNNDSVAVVRTRSGKVRATWSTRLPDQELGGSTPIGLALAGTRLIVSDAGANALALLDTRRGEQVGFIPTEWYPTAVVAAGDDLFVTTGKGKGTGPNNGPPLSNSKRSHPYIASILPGSVARIGLSSAISDLDGLTKEVIRSNRMDGDPPTLKFAGANPFHHAIYIVKENRTYDQVLGDLGVGNGDPSLVMYGADITPNEHALARQFGILDNFYCSGEVSGDGHVWTTAATTSDYTEKTWQIGYRSDQRSYDYEGLVLGASPLDQGQADIDTPGTGYLWSNAERNHVSHRNFGEFVTTLWCDAPAAANPSVLGTPLTGAKGCSAAFTLPGSPLPPPNPAGPNPWPWSIPILAANVATMPELRDNFDPAFADFRMDYPDQLRADNFLRALQGWTQSRAAGKDEMPALIILRLPNDHTAGTKAGFPTPSATVADNDLALGRVVEAVSGSAYWDDTAIFVLEDDAQDGADHVDAHRSTAFVISKYATAGSSGPLVDSTPYTTVSMIHSIEEILGLPAMNTNDQWAPVMAPMLTGPGQQPAFKADTRNRDNGLIYAMNSPAASGGTASATMDFTHADAVDTALLNEILWHDRKGDVPFPGSHTSGWQDDDD